MKKSFLVTFVVGSLFAASCTEDVYNPERIQEDYAQNFVELFGEINPNQDWNVAELKSVTVDPGSSTEVQIYAFNGDVYKLVGDYKEVFGTQTLTFDAAKDVDDFIVSVGGQGKLVKNGETVSFADAGTRSYNSDVQNVFKVEDTYETFPWDDVMAYANRLPEKDRWGNSCDNTKVPGLSTDFNMIMGSQKITVYPVYWNADYDHTLGIYWYEGNSKRERDIYTDKGDRSKDVHLNVRWKGERSYEWVPVTWNTFEEPKKRGSWGREIRGTINESEGIRSYGFTIELPVNTRYGFYIKVDDGSNRDKTYYTDESLNGNNGVMAAYFKQKMDNGTTRTFLGFEDMPGDKKDLNDLMLMIDPSPIVIDNDVVKWIVAAEDLGATDDYDFNDVVFSVEHTSGHNEATITPLAAGGSLETYLYRDGNQIGNGEFHTLLGASVNEDGTYPYVNTEAGGAAGSPITITVPVDFSLAYNDTQNIGGFSLKVDGNSQTIEAPGRGEAPQMICVPAGWKWPMERVRIDQAYPKFGEWGSNYASTEWYNEPVSGQVIE